MIGWSADGVILSTHIVVKRRTGEPGDPLYRRWDGQIVGRPAVVDVIMRTVGRVDRWSYGQPVNHPTPNEFYVISRICMSTGGRLNRMSWGPYVEWTGCRENQLPSRLILICSNI